MQIMRRIASAEAEDAHRRLVLLRTDNEINGQLQMMDSRMFQLQLDAPILAWR